MIPTVQRIAEFLSDKAKSLKAQVPPARRDLAKYGGIYANECAVKA